MKSNIKMKTLKKHGIFLVLSIVIVVLIELFLFDYTTVARFDGTNVSIFGNPDYSMETIGYDVGDNNYYKAISDDPILVFNNVNQRIDSILISFSERVLTFGNSIQVFYCGEDEEFSAENSTVQTKIPFGASKMIIDIPEAEYQNLRIDVNGAFFLGNIQISDQDIELERVKESNVNWVRMLCLFVCVMAVTIAITYYMYTRKDKCSLTRKEIFFCFLCFVFYLMWAISKPFNYAPDEAMRYDVTHFLFQHNRLPVGDELISQWGFSYAHSPTMLCNLLGYVFMKVVSLFTSSQILLLIAARMVSVCCATGAIYFIVKIGKYLFDGPARWIMVALVAFMPQYCFLASYVNNDMVAFLGVTMILYAWILGINYNWNYRNATLLSVGISICALAYYNSYSWILMSIFLFFMTSCYKNKGEYRQLRRLTIYIVCLTFVLIAYWFLRHLWLYDDLLGMSISRKYGELYAIESLKPSNRISLYEQGVSLFEMLGDKYNWLELSYKSFVGNFGYMQYQLSSWVYYAYMFFALGGFLGIIIGAIKYFHSKPKKIDILKIVLYASMVLCIVITIALTIINSYYADFQPQGRYCYPAFPAIAVFITKGYDTLLGFIEKKEHRYAIVSSIATVIACIVIYVFFSVYIPT